MGTRPLFACAVKVVEVALDVLFPEAAVAAGGDAQDGDPPLFAPAPQGVGVNVEKLGHLLDGQQIVGHLADYHNLPHSN